MSKISDKLNLINNAKESIKSSIEAKGVEVGDVSIEEYSSKIDELKTTSLVIKDARYLFYNGVRMDNYEDLINMLGELVYCNYMFYQNRAISKVDLSKINFNNVPSLQSMFYSSSATEIDFGNADFGKVNTLNQWVSYSSSLVTLKGFKNIGKAFTVPVNGNGAYTIELNTLNELSYESLIYMLTEGIYDLNLTYKVASGGTLYTQNLNLGTKNKAKLEATEEGQQALARATLKGWNVS